MSLRTLTHEGRSLVAGFPAGQVRPVTAGRSSCRGPTGSGRWTVRARNVGEVAQVEPGTLLPREVVSVVRSQSGALDFRSGRVIGPERLDHACTRLSAADGEVALTLAAPGGAGVGLRWDPALLPCVQIHTADCPEPELDRRGLAVEPMTCPPDAVRTSADLLQPGSAHEGGWTVSAT